MSDCFQFSLKGATINKTSRHSLLGALDTACISLMDWLSYSDSAVLLSLNRHFPAPDCALQAAVLLPYHFPAIFGFHQYTNNHQNWIIKTLQLFNPGGKAYTPCNASSGMLLENARMSLQACDVLIRQFVFLLPLQQLAHKIYNWHKQHITLKFRCH